MGTRGVGFSGLGDSGLGSRTVTTSGVALTPVPFLLLLPLSLRL